jgi:pyrroline-5-carboxylate reductase
MIGFIGGGNMAEALIKGLTSKGVRDILFYDPAEERVQYLMRTYGVGFVGSNIEVLKRGNTVLIAVKPQIMSSVMEELSETNTADRLFISIAAGIRLSYLMERLGTSRVIRVMPNTPALLQEGMSVISAPEVVSDADINRAVEIFSTIGKTLVLPEHKMDAVTALSGSGPGFIAYFAECLIKGGMEIGLSEDESTTLTIQTLLGSAKILRDSGIGPAKLRQMVTSPNGTTQAGLNAFDNRDLQGLIAEALKAARVRAEELGRSTN